MKTLQFIQRNPRRHWVGNGFPVRSVFSYQDRAEVFSPFLLVDHAGPTRFEPTTERRGVGQHPHRGFETVSIVYDGEVSHRDSSAAHFRWSRLPRPVGIVTRQARRAAQRRQLGASSLPPHPSAQPVQSVTGRARPAQHNR